MCTLATTAVADPIEAHPQTRNGVPGIWLPQQDAAKVLQEARKVPKLEDVVKTQDELLGLQRDQIKTATTALSESQDALRASNEFGMHFKDAYIQEVERSGGLLNEPLFWTIVGIAIGGAATGLGAYAAGN